MEDISEALLDPGFLKQVMTFHFFLSGCVCLTLTAHLDALQVPQVLHCHFKDISFLQFGVSGALQDKMCIVEFIFTRIKS